MLQRIGNVVFSLFHLLASSSDKSTHYVPRTSQADRGRPPGWKDGLVGGGLLGIWNSRWKWVSGLIPPTEGWSYHCFLFKHIASHCRTSEWYHCHTWVSPHVRPRTSWSFDNSNLLLWVMRSWFAVRMHNKAEWSILIKSGWFSETAFTLDLIWKF